MLLLAPASSAEEEDELKKASEAVSSIEAHEKRINAIQVEYVQGCIASTKRLVEELERSRSLEIRRENLRTATAIQERIDEYERMLKEYREALASLRLGKNAQGSLATKLPDRVYIWNSFQGDRGVRVIDIELRKGGQLVKELKGIKLGLQKNKAVRTIVKLPELDFDEIEIQVMEWHGHSAGLAEVALARGKTNLTGNYDMNAPLRGILKDARKNLTDESLDTEWFAADGRRAKINFKLIKPDPDHVVAPGELDKAEGEKQGNKPELDDDGFFGLPTERKE